MRMYLLSVAVLGTLVAFAVISVSYSDAQNPQDEISAYFRPEPINIRGEFWSLGKSTAGRQLFVRKGTVFAFSIQPRWDIPGDDWEITIFFGNQRQRYYFEDQQKAQAAFDYFLKAYEVTLEEDESEATPTKGGAK